jgi:uncharacterized protein YbaR (Trm112 family)
MESVSPDLVEILVCPESRQPVRLATPEELEAVNQRIRSGELRNRGGNRVPKELGEALVREDTKVLYPVDDGIPVMLIEESIELSASDHA